MSLYDYTRDMVRTLYDARIHTPAILDTAHFFPNAHSFTDRWREIRDEALAIKADLARVPRFHDIMPEQADISANDGIDWRMHIMRAYGVNVPQNLARCPTVASALEEAPEVTSCVMSFLAPGKTIPVHRGPFRGILRFHLMLTMPRTASGEPAAVLEVDGKPYLLDEGQSMLWDDTYPHAAWNRSDEVRVALLLDVWRRDMPYDMELLSRGIAAGVRFGMRFNGVSYGG